MRGIKEHDGKEYHGKSDQRDTNRKNELVAARKSSLDVLRKHKQGIGRRPCNRLVDPKRWPGQQVLAVVVKAQALDIQSQKGNSQNIRNAPAQIEK